jgi:hypothetical protein
MSDKNGSTAERPSVPLSLSFIAPFLRIGNMGCREDVWYPGTQRWELAETA